MNKEELKTVLMQYGVNKYGTEDYYIDLASFFCKSYISVFTMKKILESQDSYSLIQTSRLPLKHLFSKEEADDLAFDDNHIFYLDGKRSFEMNIKNQVRKIWPDGLEQRLNNVTYVDAYLNSLNEKDRRTLSGEVNEYQEKLVFLSYFYKYVLNLLEESIGTQVDSIRTGCFKNAYFDVINYKKLELDIGRNK